MENVAMIFTNFIRVSLKVRPDLNAVDGSITSVYNRDSFEDLWTDIGELYHTFILMNIPTKTLNIDITDTEVNINLKYEGLKILLGTYSDYLARKLKNKKEGE